MIQRACLALLLLCAACGQPAGGGPASLASGRDLAQPLGEMRMSGVGDPLVTLTRRREGPPPSGQGDILGGTGGGAVTVLSYRGLRDGQAVFERRDILLYQPEGMARTLLDGGSSEILLDPAALPESIVVDGVFLRVVEADRYVVRYLLSRNRL